MNAAGTRPLRELTRRWLFSPLFASKPLSGREICDFVGDELGLGSAKPDDVQEGLRLARKGEYQRASEVVSEDLRRYATLADLLAMASRCESSLGRQLQAADLAVAGLTIDPENDHAWFVAIQSLHIAGRTREARSGYKLAPDRARARLDSIGVFGGGRSDPALAFFSFQTKDPVDLASKLTQGEILQTKGCLRNLARWQWRRKDFKSALEAYKKLIRLSLGSVIPLLLTRSFCHYQLKQSWFAAMDVSTALALDPGDNYQTRLEILDGRQRILEAMSLPSAVERTVSFRENYSAEHCKKRLWGDEPEPKGLEKDGGGTDSNKKKTHEDEMLETLKGEGPKKSAEDFEMLDALVRALPPEKRSFSIDVRVPRFHDEYNAGPHLEHSNHSKCMKWLTRAYGESTFVPKKLNVYKVMGSDGAEKEDILHRLPYRTPEWKKWWENAKIGDVQQDFRNRSYPPDMLHSFSNVRTSIPLQFGKTHVAVGYVDLGLLLRGKFVGDEKDGPVKFVGYEMSPYSTAKTHVMYQLLKNQAAIKSVLQVGYSAGWSRETLEEFRLAAKQVIEEIVDLPASVKDLIEHWSVAPEVNLKDAQDMWLDLHDSHGCLPANVINRNDRLEIVKYMLSGRILECSVGSTVMFGNPSDYPHIAWNEYAYWTISAKDLGQYHKSCGSIMSVVVRLMEARIRTLREHVIAGRVEIELRLRGVYPNDLKTLEEIRSLRPWSISWSNLCDHTNPFDFHEMAESCSAPRETIHYHHSMNWPKLVKGACLVDYPSLQMKMDKVDLCLERCAKAIDHACGRDILLSPPVANPYNVAFELCEDFYEKWLEEFLDVDDLDERHLGSKYIEPYSLFDRVSGVIHFSITYDPIMAIEGGSDRSDGSLSASLSRLAVSK